MAADAKHVSLRARPDRHAFRVIWSILFAVCVLKYRKLLIVKLVEIVIFRTFLLVQVDYAEIFAVLLARCLLYFKGWAALYRLFNQLIVLGVHTHNLLKHVVLEKVN